MTVGETMVLLDPLDEGEIRPDMSFTLRVAGAESNFAVALTRLGLATRWISRLGDDPLGGVIHETLSNEGLDLDYVQRDKDSFTAVFFKWREGGRSLVHYLRRGSAAARLTPGSVPDEAFDGIELVHLTGITMALSDSARDTVIDVARRAKQRGLLVTFDPNFRPALWSGPEAATEAHRAVFEYVDWYLCGLEEGNRLFGTDSEESLARAIRGAGLDNAVARVGDKGALVICEQEARLVQPRRLETVVDEIGAGDGFAAGFVYGLLQSWHHADCAAAGNLIAARALVGTGDWETFPHLHEVEHLLAGGPRPSHTG
ncbi:MAG: sugar kinase [Actinomycetota bacterium]